MAVKRKEYINKKEMYKQIVLSKAYGKLTKPAEDMLIRLANETIKRKSYRSDDDKHDCLYAGIQALFSNWFNFNEEKFDNSFAYFTEIFKRGIAGGMNALYKKKGQKKDQKITVISMNSSNDGDGLISL
jgi:hypothetical protein